MLSRLAFTVAVAVCAIGLNGAAPGAAHAVLVRSVPADRAQLASPPDHLDLYFSQQLVQSHNGTFATVYDGAGKAVSDEGRLDAKDGTHLVVPLRGTLDSGEYTVFWKSTSDEDGGVSLGSFSFSIGTPAAATAQAGGQVTVPDQERGRALSLPSRSSSGAGAALLGGVGLAIGLVAGAAATFLATRRRRTAPSQRFTTRRR